MKERLAGSSHAGRGRGRIPESERTSLLTSLYAAGRSGFDLKYLADDEISFLYEYVST